MKSESRHEFLLVAILLNYYTSRLCKISNRRKFLPHFQLPIRVLKIRYAVECSVRKAEIFGNIINQGIGCLIYLLNQNQAETREINSQKYKLIYNDYDKYCYDFPCFNLLNYSWVLKLGKGLNSRKLRLYILYIHTIHTHHLMERVLQYFQTEFQVPST